MTISDKNKRLLSSIGLFVLFLAVGLALDYASWPPSPVPASAPATEFSAERALTHIQAFAIEPHPAGTPAADRIREYIIGAFAGMGIDAEESVSIISKRSRISEVHNILARIPGSANTKAFALIAHYDSTPYGPGAADDGSGVGAILETARAIKAGSPLKNDVMFVITDGEESGLTGARAFADHPWARDVGVLLNMETRGTSGPSSMFETTPNNGWLIRQLIKSGASVRASSLSYDIYKRMPTKSDLTVLRQYGFKGYNIAFIEDLPYYHTVNDNPENLSLASLQHHGSYTLNLARHFGNMPLDKAPTAPDAVYFNIFGPLMVSYPAAWSAPLAIAGTLILCAVLLFGYRRGRLTIPGMMYGAALVLAAGIITVLITAAIMAFAYHRNYVYVLYNTRKLNASCLMVAFLVTGLLFRAFVGRITAVNLVAGALGWWFLLMVGLQAVFPLGNYFALWSLVGGSLGLFVLTLWPDNLSVRRVYVHSLFVLPVFLLIIPSMRGMLAGLTAIMAPLLMLPAVLFLGLLGPQVRYVFPREHRLAYFAIVPLSIWIWFAVQVPIGPTTPLMNSVSYGLDRATGQAWWLSSDKVPDEWTSQFFPPGSQKQPVREFVPFERKPRLKAPAPIADLAPPTVQLLNDTKLSDGTREVSLRLTSPRGVPELRFYIDPPASVRKAQVDGHKLWVDRLPYGGGGWFFSYEIFPRSGAATIDLVLESDAPVSGTIIEKSYELPQLPYKPRPPYMITKPNSLDWFEHTRLRSGHTFVLTPFNF